MRRTVPGDKYLVKTRMSRLAKMAAQRVTLIMSCTIDTPRRVALSGCRSIVGILTPRMRGHGGN